MKTDSITLLPGRRSGNVQIPSSKSAAHRLLICAALGEGNTILSFNGLSKDIQATADCLQAMGIPVSICGHEIYISHVPFLRQNPILLCGESGSTLRFLLPVAGALGMSGCFEMEGRLPKRPMTDYILQLIMHGMTIFQDGSRLYFEGQLQSGEYCLPGNVSSQYFSGLLMALPRLSGDSTIIATGKLESAGYIRMTEDALTLSGVRFEREETWDRQIWHIPGNQCFTLPATLSAEGDWSNAAFFLCMGALSEEGVTVRGLNLDSDQGDKAILDILRRFGASVGTGADSVTGRRGELRPVVIDAAPIPDLIPVLSVLACGAQGDSRIENAARLRLKESDRLQSTARLINDLGGKAEELPEGLVIHGTGRLRGGTVDPCNDHRIAMSAAVAACLCRESVTVTGANCVQKSYPAFWDDFGRCAT